MDYTNIPSCALFRHGTVIVRMKMEVTCGCGHPGVCPVAECPEAVHRLPNCEQCSRTRIHSQYSDCDSGLVNKCRPYRASSARSRYVRVCAAVCLLLLVGDLTPQSSAAPHRTHSMERARRGADATDATAQENQTWGNACDLDSADNCNPAPITYEPKLANNVKQQAINAYNRTNSYKEHVASLHSLDDFQALLKQWNRYKWMHIWNLNNEDNPKVSWFGEETMPAKKVYGTPVSDEYVNELMPKIDEVLPSMYKALKVVVASLYAISDGTITDASKQTELESNIANTGFQVRSVLCEFQVLIRSRKLEQLPLTDDELPFFDPSDRIRDTALVYRDTLNYLEYIQQVMKKMAETISA